MDRKIKEHTKAHRLINIQKDKWTDEYSMDNIDK